MDCDIVPMVQPENGTVVATSGGVTGDVAIGQNRRTLSFWTPTRNLALSWTHLLPDNKWDATIENCKTEKLARSRRNAAISTRYAHVCMCSISFWVGGKEKMLQSLKRLLQTRHDGKEKMFHSLQRLIAHTRDDETKSE